MMDNVKLVEICNPKQWKTLSTQELIENGNFPVYGANGIIGYYNIYNHENETVLITCRGATCGNVHISRKKSYINGNAMALDDLNEEICNKKYIYYYLKNYNMNEVISGSAQPQITRQGLKRIIVKLYNLDKQKEIVKILDKIQEIIDLRKKQIEELDEIIKSLFVEMFGNIVNNSKKYNCERLENISDIKSGGTPSRSNPNFFKGNIPWITTVSLGKNIINEQDAIEFITQEAVNKSATKIIPKGSLLFGIRVGVGKISMNEVDMCTNQDIVAIMNIDKRFRTLFLKKAIEEYSNYFNNQKRGATIQGITSGMLKEIQIPIIELELQDKYIKILQQIDKQKFMIEKSLKETEELQESLMNKYFN